MNPTTIAARFAPLTICMSMLVAGAAGSVFGDAMTTSNVTADWSSFTIAGGTLGTDYLLPPDVPAGERAQGANANATNNLNPGNPQINGPIVFSQNDWADVPTVVNSILNSEGRGGITSNELGVNAMAKADGIGTLEANSSGFVFRNTDFEVPGLSSDPALTLTFEFDYSVIHNLNRDALDESGSVFSQVNLTLSDRDPDGNGGIITTEFDRQEQPYSTQLDGLELIDAAMIDDTISIVAAFERGRQYRVEGQLYTQASARAPQQLVIPEPSAAVIAALGLLSLGLVGWRRLRR